MDIVVKCGIYEIVNTANGKRYIGSSVDVRRRFADHIRELSRGTHHSAPLQRAWIKYGKDAFVFRQLVACQDRHLIEYEQRAIDGFAPEYNVCMVAGNSLGIKRSAETRAKMSASATGVRHSLEAREKMSASKTGLKQSEETKARRAAALRGRPLPRERRAKISAALTGKTLSPETKAKKSLALRGKPWSSARRAASRKG